MSVSEKAVARYQGQKNIKFLQGNILALEEWEDNTFDAVIVQTVLHHLAGENMEQTERNVAKGLCECIRVLKPGGVLLLVESVVKPWFERIEKILYPVMQLFFREIHFDAVYQYSYQSLCRKIGKLGLSVTETAMIEMDRYIWICRKKVPTKLTPCRACWIVVKK